MKLIDPELKEKIPSIFKSKVFYIVVAYLVYLTFFNQYNLLTQFSLFKELRQLSKEEKFYEKSIVEIKEQQADIFKDRNSIEKFAREKYWMKKDSEEIYIFVPKE
ncbi:MAG TPA: septum formation initiator family protein [Chitinophagales bacterium]|nr:septum formation initiator family protein [Chitinophagales bacterium]